MIKKLCKKLGTSWTEKSALPMFTNYFNNKNYLYRENSLFGLKAICVNLSPATIVSLAQQLSDMAKRETIPNVLVLILQTMHEFEKTVTDNNLRTIAHEMYKALTNHPDSDVQSHASQYATST